MSKSTITVTRSYLVRRIQKVTVPVPDEGFDPHDFGTFDEYVCAHGTFDLAAEAYEPVDNDEIEHSFTTVEKRSRNLEKGDVFLNDDSDMVQVVKKNGGGDDVVIKTRDGSRYVIDGDSPVDVYLTEPPHEMRPCGHPEDQCPAPGCCLDCGQRLVWDGKGGYEHARTYGNFNE